MNDVSPGSGASLGAGLYTADMFREHAPSPTVRRENGVYASACHYQRAYGITYGLGWSFNIHQRACDGHGGCTFLHVMFDVRGDFLVGVCVVLVWCFFYVGVRVVLIVLVGLCIGWVAPDIRYVHGGFGMVLPFGECRVVDSSMCVRYFLVVKVIRRVCEVVLIDVVDFIVVFFGAFYSVEGLFVYGGTTDFVLLRMGPYPALDVVRKGVIINVRVEAGRTSRVGVQFMVVKIGRKSLLMRVSRDRAERPPFFAWGCWFACIQFMF